jgi:hypothetical protein
LAGLADANDVIIVTEGGLEGRGFMDNRHVGALEAPHAVKESIWDTVPFIDLLSYSNGREFASRGCPGGLD